MLSKVLLLLFVLLQPVALAAQQHSKTTQNTVQPNIDYKQPGAPMPPLIFLAYNDTATANIDKTGGKKKREKRKKTEPTDTANLALYYPVTDKDLDNDANLIVMMFNPTCLHCEDVAFLLEKHVGLFKKSKVVLLASKMMTPYLPDFAERHHIGRYPAMYIGYDSSGFIDNVFLYQTLPQLNIYSGDRKLLKTYCGEVPIDTLKRFIQ